MVSNVSAADPVEGIKKIGNGFLSLVTSLAQNLFGTGAGGTNLFFNDDLFATVLFFLLLLGITWAILDRISFINGHSGIMVILAIAVPILSIRFLKSDYIHMLLIPYSTFGVVALTLIPLVLLFIIIETSVDSSVFRKLGWIISACAFIGLYFTRLSEINEQFAIWIYPVAALACLVFLFADKTIQRAWRQHKWEQGHKIAQRRRAIRLANRRAEADRALEAGGITPQMHREEIEDIGRQLSEYG
jgi:hypothetical protein